MNNNSNMRLFIAITFDAPTKNAAYEVLERLKSFALKGSYTYKENLHLTIVFIGEVPVSKIDTIKDCMDRVESRPFTITMEGIGHFRRNGGDIYWIGVNKNSTLLSIYNQLYDELTKAGFTLEKRKYKPHLTLGRRVIVRNGFDEGAFSRSVPRIKMNVKNISLMKSERINGKLTYTQIYQKELLIEQEFNN